MSDPLKKVSPGEKLPRFPAALFNDLVEVAGAHRAKGQMGQRDAGKQYAAGIDLRCLNDTGSTLSRFGVVRVASPFIGTDDNEPEAFANPNVTGLAPLGNDFAWGVLQEPLADGAVGKVRLAGVTWARVNVTSTAHRFARPVAGSLTTLVSSSLGGAPILTPVAATGVHWHLIRLESACDCPGDGTGSGGPVDVCEHCPAGALEAYCAAFPGLVNENETVNAAAALAGPLAIPFYSGCAWSIYLHNNGYPLEVHFGYTGATVTVEVYAWISVNRVLMAEYSLSIDDWGCNAAVELSRSTPAGAGADAAGYCSNWPPTITVGECGSGGSGAIEGLGLGTWSSGDDTTATELTGAGVEVAAGSYLLVTLGIVQAESEDEFNTPPAVTWNGDALTPIAWQYEADGGDFTGLLLYGLHVTAGATGDIVATLASARVCLMHARQVTGLADFAPDDAQGSSGTGGDDPLNVVTANEDAEYLSMSFLAKEFTTAYAWGTQFASAGQEVSVEAGGNTYTLTEGYKITSAASTYTGTLDGATQTLWASIAGGVS